MELSGLVVAGSRMRLGRAGEQRVPSHGLVAGAAVEGFADRPANVAVAGAGIPEDLGSSYHQGGADPLSLPGRRHADASDGPGGGAEHGSEHGLGARAMQQQG